MNKNQDLDRIALGDAPIEEARRILQAALTGATTGSAEAIAASLRAWTWKALTSRRIDQELEGWYELLRRVAARLTDLDPRQATRVELLAELIHESIISADMSSADFVLQRSHTRAMLALVASAHDGRMDREQIGNRLSLQQANLTRVLNMLVAAGLVSKTTEGKRVIVEITRSGQREAERLQISRPTAEGRDTADLRQPASPERIEAMILNALRRLDRETRVVQTALSRAHRNYSRIGVAPSAIRAIVPQGHPGGVQSLAASPFKLTPVEKPGFESPVIVAAYTQTTDRFRANVFPGI